MCCPAPPGAGPWKGKQQRKGVQVTTHHRSTRVAEAIKEEVGSILLHRLKDSRVQSERVSVTNVEVSGDLRHATIFVSILARTSRSSPRSRA